MLSISIGQEEFILINWAVVVTQLAEQMLPTPEVRGSNPVIYLLSTVLKDKNKEKRCSIKKIMDTDCGNQS